MTSNEKLIAAAPELLSALKAMIEPFVDEDGPNGRPEISDAPFLRPEDWWGGMGIKERVEAALVAIAKAEC